MSEFTTPARRTPGHDGVGAHQPVAQSTMSGTGPVRPEDGSPLARLLSRQTNLAASGPLLGFVPAQVR